MFGFLFEGGHLW